MEELSSPLYMNMLRTSVCSLPEVRTHHPRALLLWIHHFVRSLDSLDPTLNTDRRVCRQAGDTTLANLDKNRELEKENVRLFGRIAGRTSLPTVQSGGPVNPSSPPYTSSALVPREFWLLPSGRGYTLPRRRDAKWFQIKPCVSPSAFGLLNRITWPWLVFGVKMVSIQMCVLAGLCSWMDRGCL